MMFKENMLPSLLDKIGIGMIKTSNNLIYLFLLS